jgi:pimeloyl-ACP methyl ester carboxylesterase
MGDPGDMERPTAEPNVIDIDGPVRVETWHGPAERTFVLLHGLGGSHLNWRRVAPELSRSGRVLVPDLPGFGRTPRAGRSASLLAGRRIVAELIRRQGRGAIVLAGNSMGGAIALLQAAFEPDSVAGVVATAAVLPWARGGVPAAIVMGGFAVYQIPAVGDWVVRNRFRRLPAERAVRLGFRITTCDPASVPESLVREHAELLRLRMNDAEAPAAFLEGARSILRLLRRSGSYGAALRRVRCPVLLIHGERDRFVPVAFARAAGRAHADWELLILPHVGHVPQLEAPGSWVESVTAWLPRTEERHRRPLGARPAEAATGIRRSSC